ncbi:MAG: serine--tRNA ligase [Planctomycetota bacterium]
MLDIKFIRENAGRVARAIELKGGGVEIGELLSTDERRRKHLAQIDELRHQRKVNSEEVARSKREGKDASALIARTREIGEEIRELEGKAAEQLVEFEGQMLQVPNVLGPGVPDAADATGNVVVRTWGTKRTFDFAPRAHWDIGVELGLVDFDRGAKLSGSGFILYTGWGARLERALWNFMLDLHTTKHGFKELFPPFLVNRRAMTGTGQLPKLENEMYRCDADDLFLIPTAEVPVTNVHQDEILPEGSLPIYYTAYTACFRREAGAAGKDTRGMIRVHQFDKVELVKIVRPETSYEELESLVACAEAVLQALELPYRVVILAGGDTSFAASKCYDLEVYAPGCDRWLEVSSCSNFEDFQARRINVRYRDAKGKVRFVHTLNGSGVALPRLVIAILENYQQGDGSVTVPDALRPYLANKGTLSRADA